MLTLDAQGLLPADIAAALRLSIPAVQALLTTPATVDDAAAVHESTPLAHQLPFHSVQ